MLCMPCMCDDLMMCSYIKGVDDALGMIEIRDEKGDMVLSDVRTQICDEVSVARVCVCQVPHAYVG